MVGSQMPEKLVRSAVFELCCAQHNVRFSQARVDHITYSRHSDRRFGYVRGQDYAWFAAGIEDTVLIRFGHAWHKAARCRTGLEIAMRQVSANLLFVKSNFTLCGLKYKNVPRWFCLQFIDGRYQGIGVM